MSLNPQQLAAIQSNQNTLIIAGPGTGKTHTIISRTNYWIEQGIAPQKFLLLTFTNKAASEMQTRLQQPHTTASTIHSFCFQLIKDSHTYQNEPLPQLINQSDQLEIFKKLDIKIKTNTINQISLSKIGLNTDSKDIQPFLRSYNAYLKQHQFIDYDDLLIMGESVLKNARNLLSPKLRQRLQNIQQILVDEFQDLNQIQYNIVRHIYQINTGEVTITAVGDPKQGIYAFRGSYPQIFDQFTADYHPKTFTFTTNYRSNQSILDTYHLLFPQSPNLQTYATQTYTSTSPSFHDKVFHIHTHDDKTEAFWIIRSIKALLSQDPIPINISNYIIEYPVALKDIIVSYRNYQSIRTIAKKLDTTSLPYTVISQKKWLEYDQIKTLVKQLSLLQYPQNTTIKPHLTLKNLINQTIFDNLKIKPQELPQNYRLWRISELANSFGSKPWPTTLPLFLDQINLWQQEDTYDSNADKLRLMSIHRTKGLEAKIVFFVGLENGIIPHQKVLDSDKPEQIAQERNLLYVALSRAQHHLFFTTTDYRFGQKSTPSPLLSELNSHTYQTIQDPLAQKYAQQQHLRKLKNSQSSLF